MNLSVSIIIMHIDQGERHRLLRASSLYILYFQNSQSIQGYRMLDQIN